MGKKCAIDEQTRRAVVCWETGEVFENAASAAAAKGLKAANGIYRSMRCGTSSGGLHWYWANQPKPDADRYKRQKRGNRRAAVCWETGAKYESLAAAAKDTGIPESSIRHAVNTGKPGGGLHWYCADDAKQGIERIRKAIAAKKNK